MKTLERFSGTLTKDQLTKPAVIEKEFKSFCKDLKSKENRFCYFLGGTADAATGILGEMSKPLSWGMPALKVCEKLKKKDRQVCELAYGKSFSTVKRCNHIHKAIGFFPNTFVSRFEVAL